MCISILQLCKNGEHEAGKLLHNVNPAKQQLGHHMPLQNRYCRITWMTNMIKCYNSTTVFLRCCYEMVWSVFCSCLECPYLHCHNIMSRVAAWSWGPDPQNGDWAHWGARTQFWGGAPPPALAVWTGTNSSSLFCQEGGGEWGHSPTLLPCAPLLDFRASLCSDLKSSSKGTHRVGRGGVISHCRLQ